MSRMTIVTLLAAGSLLHASEGFAQIVPDAAEPLPAQQSDQSPVPPTPAAPKHVSTGWSALFKDTVRDFKNFPLRPSTWVILGAGGGASYVSQFGDDYVQEHIVGNPNADKFFMLGQWVGSAYVMAASSVGLWAVGRYVVGPSQDEPKTNKWSAIGFDMMRGQILAQAVTHGTKNIVRRDRPTGECCSFPSGHAASAFAAAAVLERHLGYRGSWPFIAGATYVATSRLVDNRHFLSDVVFGAAVGTAAGWTVVGRRHGVNEFTMEPVPVKGGMRIAVSKVPHHPASEHGLY
ncbi:MAG TPA: phosphatase PAP2 family protein [Vicinamibacterales bacterium]